MKKNNLKPKGFNSTWIYAIIGLLLIGFFLITPNIGSQSKSLDRGTFNSYIQKGYVDQVDLDLENNKVSVYLTNEALKQEEFKHFKNQEPSLTNFGSKGPNYTFTIADAGNFEKEFNDIVSKSQNKNVKLNTITPDAFSKMFINIFLWMLFFGVIYFFVFRRMGGPTGGGQGGIFNVGKSKAKLFEGEDHIKTTFKDVAGLEGAKEEIEEIVEFLRNPDKFTKLGGKIPKELY